jgi:hypothetical protein
MHAVEPADEIVPVPYFDRVAMAEGKQVSI